MITSTEKGRLAAKTPAQGNTHFELRHGDYVAAVTLQGAALGSLRHGGRNLVVDLTRRYCLSAAGLQGTVTAANPGPATVPYGVCPHPYLIAGSAPLDDWSLVVPADRFLQVTPDRLLPVGEVSVEGHDFDFRNGNVLRGVEIDHAFTGISRDSHGTARVCVYDPSGTGVELAWGREWPWVQVHTGDKPSGPDRLGLAVEPMTCPPDAFNSGRYVVELAPGQEHAGSWSIRALQRSHPS